MGPGLRTLALSGVSLLVLTIAGGAAAQTAPPPPSANSATSLEEVVVTAQRRTEALQDVAISVAAYSGDSLRKQGVTASTDIAKFTPGITVSGTVGGQGLQFSIRGVTQSDFNDAIEAPVAVYVDDVYISSQQGQGLAVFDLARVEALKGPQGTLFGRNATGGLLHFVVNKPALGETSGYVNGTYGTFNQTTLEGAVNLPLGDQFAVRASGIWNRHDSVWKNVYPGGMAPGAPLSVTGSGPSPRGEDLGDQDDLSGRLQLLWEPSSKVQARLTGSALRQNMSSSPWTSSSVVPEVDTQGRNVGEIYASPTETRAVIGPQGQNVFNPATYSFQKFFFSPGNNGLRTPGADWFGYTPVNIKDRQLSSDYARSDLNRFKAYNIALHLDADLGFAQLASVTAWSEYQKNFLLDVDGSPFNALGFATKSDIQTYSQEVRLSRQAATYTWTVGAYYLDIDAHDAQGLIAPIGSGLAAIFGRTATGVDPMSVYTLKTSSASVFAQGSWEFAPHFTAVLGGRLINERQSYNYFSGAFVNDNDYTVDTKTLLFPLLPAFKNKRTEDLWAGKAQVEYRPDTGMLYYIGVNRGVKGGSYNAQNFSGDKPIPPSEIPYRPEVLTSLEGGFKLTGAGSRYTLNMSAFHYWYDDYQSFIFLNLTGVVQNVQAETNGLEAEGSLRITPDLRLVVSGTALDARVKNLTIAPGVTRDTRPTYTPKYAGSARLTYSVPQQVFGGGIEVGALASFQSSFYHNARNFDGDLIKGRTLLDLTANWTRDSLSVSAFLKNAFDERYKTVGLDLATVCGCNLEAYGMPRTAGLAIGYKF